MGRHEPTRGKRVVRAILDLAVGTLVLAVICAVFGYLKLRHVI